MSRMFPFITVTWNPFTGPCPYECTYCWAKSLINRYKWAKYTDAGPGIDEKQINKTFRPIDFVFVQDMSDASTAAMGAVARVMTRVKLNPDTRFLFLTKNPSSYLHWVKNIATMPPSNAILGATIETNYGTILQQVSKAPPPNKRLEAMQTLSDLGFKTFVSMEPIMDFNKHYTLEALTLIHPWAVAIGYDNYHNDLPEPPLEKTNWLINSLELKGIKVYRKTLREPRNRREDHPRSETGTTNKKEAVPGE